MTMRLTLALPSTPTDLRAFVDACTLLHLPTVSFDHVQGDLVGHGSATAEPPAAAPEPEAIAKALPHAAKVAKRTAKKAPAKKKAPTNAGGDTAQAILTALHKIGGRWDGSASAFVKHAGLGHHALNVLPKLAIAGQIRLLKLTPTGRVTAIELADAQAPANVTALPQPAPARHPANPAPRPAGGIKPPSGGWA